MAITLIQHRIDPAVLAHAYPNAFAGHVRAEFDRRYEAANHNAITCAPGHASRPNEMCPTALPLAMRAVAANAVGGAGHAVIGDRPAP